MALARHCARCLYSWQTMSTPDLHLIFVIDDDASLRDDLVDYLLGEGYRALGFASYEQFVPASELLQPALVVLDLGLPGLDGMAACQLLRQRWPHVGVVMLTSRSGVEQQQAGLQAGADAYLLKTASLPLVQATVASVLRRLTSASLLAASNASQNTASHASANPPKQPTTDWALRDADLCLLTPNAGMTVLSVNEFRLVHALMAAHGQSVPRPKLLALVGKSDSVTNRRNLDGVISRIRAKVRQQAGADLPLRSSYSNGYAFVPGRAADTPTNSAAVTAAKATGRSAP